MGYLVGLGPGEIILRLVAAAVLGGLIGLERQRRRHPAGLRTHTLVCLGSALVMIISEDIANRYLGVTNADPARIAAQVVSGIGFLGAGTIMREGLTVRGLTTAASLWVVAALGLAIGGGYYLPALVTTALSLITLSALNRLEHAFLDWGHNAQLRLRIEDKVGRLGAVAAELSRLQVQTRSIHVEPAGDDLAVEITVYCSHRLPIEDLTQRMLSVEGVHEVEGEMA